MQSKARCVQMQVQRMESMHVHLPDVTKLNCVNVLKRTLQQLQQQAGMAAHQAAGAGPGPSVPPNAGPYNMPPELHPQQHGPQQGEQQQAAPWEGNMCSMQEGMSFSHDMHAEAEAAADGAAATEAAWPYTQPVADGSHISSSMAPALGGTHMLVAAERGTRSPLASPSSYKGSDKSLARISEATTPSATLSGALPALDPSPLSPRDRQARGSISMGQGAIHSHPQCSLYLPRPLQIPVNFASNAGHAPNTTACARSERLSAELDPQMLGARGSSGGDSSKHQALRASGRLPAPLHIPNPSDRASPPEPSALLTVATSAAAGMPIRGTAGSSQHTAPGTPVLDLSTAAMPAGQSGVHSQLTDADGRITAMLPESITGPTRDDAAIALAYLTEVHRTNAGPGSSSHTLKSKNTCGPQSASSQEQKGVCSYGSGGLNSLHSGELLAQALLGLPGSEHDSPDTLLPAGQLGASVDRSSVSMTARMANSMQAVSSSGSTTTHTSAAADQSHVAQIPTEEAREKALPPPWGQGVRNDWEGSVAQHAGTDAVVEGGEAGVRPTYLS